MSALRMLPEPLDHGIPCMKVQAIIKRTISKRVAISTLDLASPVSILALNFIVEFTQLGQS